ncbi:Regulator of G-protein signaling 20 [Temnothorax longispinosus]|uniref:Regulator of G-protein signaling 20 n=1 Tax=Temnothorax longispinosus TaxID=300112 RepID=A0A4V3S883_9HYME|nr:Regulator of G-protein signaling 20 [Temnothorax longispinosus]
MIEDKLVRTWCADSEGGCRFQMSSGLGATAMGIGVSHGTGGEDGSNVRCRLSLAAVGGNSTGTGADDQGKKKGNAGVGGEHGSGISVTDFAGAGAGNGLDGLDGLDGGLERCSLEEVRTWGSSFDKLMKSAAGRKLFREFLVSEYSEENIAFWLACEQLKRESNPEKIEEKARYIYEDYISILSPKEVSLDSRVREIVNRNMVEPTPHTFDEAQLQIYTLMHRDSYPRFVNSEIYRRVARMNNSAPPSPSTGQEHSVTIGRTVRQGFRNTLLVGEPPSRQGIARADMADEANPSQEGISIPSGGRRAFWSRQIARTEVGSLFSDSLFHAKAQRGHEFGAERMHAGRWIVAGERKVTRSHGDGGHQTRTPSILPCPSLFEPRNLPSL